jgi:predicted DNA-binding protein
MARTARAASPNANALRNAKVPSIIEVADLYTAAEVAQLVRTGRSHVDRAG